MGVVLNRNSVLLEKPQLLKHFEEEQILVPERLPEQWNELRDLQKRKQALMLFVWRENFFTMMLN